MTTSLVMNKPEILELGLRPYREVQEQLFKEGIERDQLGLPPKHHLIFCSHFPVYTLGRNASEAFISGQARQSGAEIIRIQRGGEVTFHGPGQLVVYPILNLNALSRFGVKAVESLLEGKTNYMVGMLNDKVALTPLEQAIKGTSEIDKELLRVSDIMTT